MNIFGYVLIVFTLLLTVFVGIKQPKMHTKIFVYDSQYEIVEDNKTPPVETTVKTEEIPTVSVENNESRIQIAMDEAENPTVRVEVKQVEQPKTETQTQKKTQVKTTTPKTTTKPINQTTQTQQKTTKTAQAQPKTTQTTQQKQQVSQQRPQTTTVQTQTQPTQTQTVVKTAPVQTTVKVLTAQEEEIAWNVWRSNLQNKIMRESRLPNIPIGVVFKVSFDVDKYGKITNLQTWSTDSRYTPYAIEFVAPVIKSFQGKPILNFPQGSQRTKTTFTGSWKIAATAKYSKPDDYNDTERVIK